MPRQAPSTFDRTAHIPGMTPRGTPPVEGRMMQRPMTAPRIVEDKVFTNGSGPLTFNG
jgi:hypothetical protein